MDCNILVPASPTVSVEAVFVRDAESAGWRGGKCASGIELAVVLAMWTEEVGLEGKTLGLWKWLHQDSTAVTSIPHFCGGDVCVNPICNGNKGQNGATFVTNSIVATCEVDFEESFTWLGLDVGAILGEYVAIPNFHRAVFFPVVCQGDCGLGFSPLGVCVGEEVFRTDAVG